MKTKSHLNWIVLGALAAASLAAAPVQSGTDSLVFHQEKPDKTSKFAGKVEAVDTTANTLTVAGVAMNVTADTKMNKGNKTITLSEIKMGDEVSGTSRQGANGKVEAVSIRVAGAEGKGLQLE